MPDNDPRLMTVFAEALERTDRAERSAYLDAACGDDAALRRRVEALLAAHDGAGRFLEPDVSGTSRTAGPETEEATRTSVPMTDSSSQLSTGGHRPNGTPTTVASPAPADCPGGFVPGQVIAGRYTLLDVLGEGGMGTVYRAGQTEPVRRQVALKLIRIGLDSRAVLARFDAERQALALMDHPNIARVYDGGTTAAGQPFFVMELVDGVPITEYCDRKRLPVPARLELFVAVCQAVQHAHQKGIIHRDLKPGNVLVTEVDGRPTPKVIDFGVARATEQKLTDLSLVDTGAIVGTPAYMSPEQADPSSMDVDTRTDIYALGVILYELLAGSPPIDAKQFRRDAFLEMLRMVREIDPPRPSTKVSTADALPSIAASRGIEPSQLKHLLQGDLDWIVMKALEKDRARRYETANGFAADVLRHLAHEPVQAAPPSRAYRVRKFVRKHRGAVVAASLVVLALLAGIAGTTWGLIHADRARAGEANRVRERDEAFRKADDARRIAGARAEELKYQLGVSDFLLAKAAYDNRDVRLAAERLDNVPLEQRGWEWHYLKRLTRGGLFTLFGHTDAVTGAAFSPDGSRIVTASRDGTAKVWDAHTGTPMLELRGHKGEVTSVAFSPDASRIVTASMDGTAKVWDSRSGTPLLEFKGHTGGMKSVAFAPDASRIVTGSADGATTVWDARSGAPLLELEGAVGEVTSVAFSPDASRVLTASWDATVTLWDARSGAPLLEMDGHTSAAFSPDASRIVGASQDDTAKVWDARSGAPLLELKGHTSAVVGVAFSPDASRIVTGSWDGTATVWDARTGSPLLELKGHTGGVYCVAFSPDASRVVTGSADQTVKVWDARRSPPLIELKGNTSAAFSPDASRIVTASRDRTAKVWDARSGAPLLELKGHTRAVKSLAFSPDGSRVVTASMDGTAKVWDARTGALLLELKGHADGVMSVAFSPDGSRVVTASQDGTAKVWDARSGAPLLEFKGHSGRVTSVAFSPGGSRVVTASQDGTAKVWDVRSGAPLLELEGHTSVAFSPDAFRIVTASRDRTATVWDARSGAPLLELKGHTRAVKSVAFSPDGSRVVTASMDGTAKVWDARTGVPLLELKGHADGVMSVAFSPDASRIVTAGWHGTAKVWDARRRSPQLELNGHTDTLLSAAFSPDGARIVTASGDRTAKVWDVRTGEPLVELKGHTDAVLSARFSPDGSRIVTGSADRTATVWDARSGAPLLQLKGHALGVTNAAFSLDASRIVTASWDQMPKVWDARSGALLLELKDATSELTSAAFSLDASRIVTESVDGTAKVWDARSGKELKREPMPPASLSGEISPDGRFIAHKVGNRVELIPLQPDTEELGYRRDLMQRNVRLYREAYDVAIKTHDAFAARFYLDLLPPHERTIVRAEQIVAPLGARLLLREDVLAALRVQPAADPEIQAACLNLAGTWPESALDCDMAAWALVCDGGGPQEDCRRGLRLATAACRLKPENTAYLNTLGVAQYRCGLLAEALESLSRSNALNEETEPSGLALLALAQHRLGQSEAARDTLARLRKLLKDPQQAGDPGARAFLREAETIELDDVFPSDPFAP